MVDIITQGGTKIYKFNAQDKKEMGHRFNYAIEQGNKVKGFKTLAQVNSALGRTGLTRLTPKSFRK